MEHVATSHGLLTPSPWIMHWAHLLKSQSTVLDLACGNGRHSIYLAGLGHRVLGIDRAPTISNSDIPRNENCGSIDIKTADLELKNTWPLEGLLFDAIIVTNYLWRPHWPNMLCNLAPGGILMVETFAIGNEQYGKPSNPQFLLRQGELLNMTQSLNIIGYEHGVVNTPRKVVQRIVAQRPSNNPSAAQAHPLYPSP
jgi:SAM-dependent methyltransferase